MHKLYLGDCLKVMKRLPTGSVDAVVTDPPAGIAFMGKDWDNFPIRNRGRRKAFNGRKATDHGFAAHVSWETTPKARTAFTDFLTTRLAESLRVAKPGAHLLCWAIPRTSHWTGTAIEDAGWVIEDRISHLFGTGFPKHKSKLKPACEDWWLATKPGGTKWLNVDGCRIGIERGDDIHAKNPHTVGTIGSNGVYRQGKPTLYDVPSGRWPANVCLSHHPDCNGRCHADCAVAALDRQSGERPGATNKAPFLATGDGNRISGGKGFRPIVRDVAYRDSGGASRFFYCAKASRKDRDEGNTHPTVKSTDLMRWLCRLVTPQGGVILDPFAGSGSTGKAAVLSGFGFLGIEQDPESFATAQRRLRAARAKIKECA